MLKIKKMIPIIRTVGLHPTKPLHHCLPSGFIPSSRTISSVSRGKDSNQIMEKAENMEETVGQDILHHYGKEYATNCEDEGFGVVYGEKQAPKAKFKERDEHQPGTRVNENMEETMVVGQDILHHYGKEYATRCEDEGFGVVYGEKQAPEAKFKERDEHQPAAPDTSKKVEEDHAG